MGNETDLSKRKVGTILRDVSVDLLSQPDAHLNNVPLCLLFVLGRAQEHGLGKQQRNVVLHEAHIASVPLKTVHEHEKVHPTIVILAQSILGRIFGLILPDVVKRFHIALFEKDWLQILQRFQDLFAWRVRKSTPFDFGEESSACGAARQACQTSQFDNFERI